MSHREPHSAVEATLTQAELAAPFALAQPEPEPMPWPARTAIVWDGPRWAEIDPATGEIIAEGEAERSDGGRT